MEEIKKEIQSETKVSEGKRINYFHTIAMYFYSYVPMIILLSMVGILLAQMYPLLTQKEISTKMLHFGAWIQVIAQIACIAVIWAMHKIVFKKNIQEMKQNKNGLKEILIAFVILYFAVVFLTPLLNAIYESTMKIFDSGFKVPSTSENQNALNESFNYSIASMLGTLLLVIIVAPVFEELVFRFGIIKFFKTFNNNKLHVVGYVLSATLFGFIHVWSAGDFAAVIPYLVSGTGFVLIFIKFKDNVMYTITIHIMWNVMATMLMFITQ